jgi:hypothetical protein
MQVYGHHDRIREGESTTQPPPPSITFTVEAGTKALDWINVGVGEYKGRSKIPVVLGFSVANGPPTIAENFSAFVFGFISVLPPAWHVDARRLEARVTLLCLRSLITFSISVTMRCS